MNRSKKLYNLFLIFVAVSMLFVSVFGSFSVADTNTEKSEKYDDNYLLSDIPDELADEPPFDPETISEKDAEDYRKWAQRDPRWGQLPMGCKRKNSGADRLPCNIRNKDNYSKRIQNIRHVQRCNAC